ncbi:hypothetical protein ACIA5D_33220 [Actinoplanes sp. NPDC051513]|uniref:hypothetical protein n=1 Tax=Actinoplanes sp. NPDC051513 TaxID=3363908 RepID=UPI0037A99679
MRRSTLLILAAGGVAGLAASRALTHRSRPAAHPGHAVTVARPVDYVTAHLPAELTDLADAIDLELRAAPGDRGTEIHVRRRSDAVSDGDIRRALRTGRSLLEAGDVLRPAVATTTPTMLNKGLRAVTGHGRERGLL